MCQTDRHMRRALVLAAGLAVIVLGAGCPSMKDPPVNCPSDTPAACPAAMPSFAADVAPIFSSICASCHTPGQQMGSTPLDSYAQIKAEAVTISTELDDCLMPPVNGPKLSEAQRLTIETWLVCGAPEN